MHASLLAVHPAAVSQLLLLHQLLLYRLSLSLYLCTILQGLHEVLSELERAHLEYHRSEHRPMLYAASPDAQRAYALVEGTYQDVGALPGHPATFRCGATQSPGACLQQNAAHPVAWPILWPSLYKHAGSSHAGRVSVSQDSASHHAVLVGAIACAFCSIMATSCVCLSGKHCDALQGGATQLCAFGCAVQDQQGAPHPVHGGK